MDEQLAQATVNALARQRDHAMNGLAHLEAQLELLSAENRDLKEQIKKLQPVEGDSPGRPDTHGGEALGNGHAQAIN